MVSTDVVRIVSKGLDWKTVTATTHEESAYLMEQFKVIKELRHIPDQDVKKWSGMGYKGRSFTGAACGVRNGDEAILVLSGAVASETFHPAEVTPGKVTRLDFQVTVELRQPDPNYAHRMYVMLDDLQTLGGVKRNLKYIRSATGETLYVGNRKSAAMLRLYDKSIDLGNPELGAYWRYEIEFKKEAALRAWKLFHVKQFDDEYLASVVWNEFDRRGIAPRFDAGSRVSTIEVGAKISSAEGQLSWMRRCVAPVVVQLVNLGYEEEVLRAIKLKHMFNRREV